MRLPRLIGHRGAAAAAPENTLAGFREARRQGALWVEFDAKLSADGAVVLMHDEKLERTTDGAGLVREASLAALKRLDAGGWFAPAFAGERVPTLDEAMACLAELGLRCNLEIKPCPGREAETAERIVAELRRLPQGPPPLLSSFSPAALRAAAAAGPEFPRAVLLEERRSGWLALALELGAVSVNIAKEAATAEWIAEMKRAHLQVLVYTVNDPARAASLLALGADGLFTDAPGLLHRAGLAAVT